MADAQWRSEPYGWSAFIDVAGTRFIVRAVAVEVDRAGHRHATRPNGGALLRELLLLTDVQSCGLVEVGGSPSIVVVAPV